VELRVIENSLVIKELWAENREMRVVPESEMEFFSKEKPALTLKFIKDKNGAITQFLAPKKDLWNRVKE